MLIRSPEMPHLMPSYQVLLNKDEVPNMEIPKLTLNFMFDKLALVLEQNQYRDAMDMIEDFALVSRRAPVYTKDDSIYSRY